MGQRKNGAVNAKGINNTRKTRLADDERLTVEFSHRKDCVASKDRSLRDYIRNVFFKVLVVDINDTEEREIGRGHASVVQITDIANERQSLRDVMDNDSADLANACFAISEDDNLREDLFRDGFPGNAILYINDLELEEAYRGQKLGYKIIHTVIRELSQYDDLVVIKPFPLNDPKGATKAWYAKAKAALSRYWSKMGFERIDDTEYFIYIGPREKLSYKKSGG